MTQRMPQDLAQKDPSLQNCLTLLRAVWQQNHEQVYRILRDLPWPESLKPVVKSYDSTRAPHLAPYYTSPWMILLTFLI